MQTLNRELIDIKDDYQQAGKCNLLRAGCQGESGKMQQIKKDPPVFEGCTINLLL
jgi:hypothetical protein